MEDKALPDLISEMYGSQETPIFPTTWVNLRLKASLSATVRAMLLSLAFFFYIPTYPTLFSSVNMELVLKLSSFNAIIVSSGVLYDLMLITLIPEYPVFFGE